jgi:hypothetical protein
MLAFETGQLTNPKYIVNFPTKRHWRDRSRMEDIDAGLTLLPVKSARGASGPSPFHRSGAGLAVSTGATCAPASRLRSARWKTCASLSSKPHDGRRRY